MKFETSYKLGPLFYIPSLNTKAADKIINHKFEGLRSCTFCLEDSIKDDCLTEAENTLHETLRKINDNMPAEERPYIFVRPRTPEHLIHIHNLYSDVHDVITGYVLPKFDLSNGEDYKKIIVNINKKSPKDFYIMPIIESKANANVSTRANNMMCIKELLDSISEYVLNVRVGGNDFCNLYGLRRNVKQTIWDIRVVSDILIDILNVFSDDYVVSGPVWEYFNKKDSSSTDWCDGLKKELALDILNGMVGKTAIHPSQLPIINESLKVSREDYEDAKRCLNWDAESGFAVQQGNTGRMNEVKCHQKWAERIVILGDTYGINE